MRLMYPAACPWERPFDVPLASVRTTLVPHAVRTLAEYHELLCIAFATSFR